MSGTETFVLELLPARGLDQSMLLPVLVGLLVVLLCTETFGWVFAGAVVPGYLASVLIIQPVTGTIVIWESLVTLAIAAGLARGLSETDAWSRFFGRERFFLILAVSLIVRIHDHAWFARWAISSLDTQFGTNLETQQEFYSVGLVLVPLTANMLWKPALHRGLLQLGVQVAITYAIVAWILLPYTNLTLSSVELTYENAAINFVGHAKAHIILLTTALLAARFNLSYGWDFNGILVPALLAMLWLTPLKLLATVGEAVVVVYLVRGWLRLPGVRNLDFEGPRKITMVFTLAFAWKLALGFALAPVFPELELRDTYGFGYLLSSLLAVKMLGCKSVRAVLLPSLTTSAGGFVLGSLAGFLLDIAAPQLPPSVHIEAPASARLASTPIGVMTLARLQVELRVHEPLAPSQAELNQLQRFWSEVAALPGAVDDDDEPAAVRPLRHRAASLGLQLVTLGPHRAGDSDVRRAWYGIVADEGPEAQPGRGTTTGLVIPGARGPVLVVPMPASEAPVAEAAALVCRRLDCRAVLVAGRELDEPGTRISPRPIELAMEAFQPAPVVILRADAGATSVHPLRGYLDLSRVWPEVRLDWRVDSEFGSGFGSSFGSGLGRRGAVGLRLPTGDQSVVLVRTTPAELEAMLIAGAPELGRDHAPLTPQRLAPSQLLEAIAEVHAYREPRGREGAGYVPPSTAELWLLERQVIEPLVAWAEWTEWAEAGALVRRPPASVGLWAAALDYSLVEFGDCELSERCAIMLRERTRRTTAGWGTLVVRRGAETRATIEVPHPQREDETWRIAAELWQVSGASGLLIAGADGPALSADGAAAERSNPDPVRPGNIATAFQAFHQAIERSSTRGGGHQVIQIRGLGSHHSVEHDVVLGLGRPATTDGPAASEAACTEALDDRLAGLVAAWGPCRVVDGSADLQRLSGAGNPQFEYSRELRGRELRVLWLSARLRARFRTDHGFAELRGLHQAGFETKPRDEIARLLAPLVTGPASAEPSDRASFERAIELARVYADTGNLHALDQLQALAQAHPNLRVEAGIGQVWRRAFVLIEWQAGGTTGPGPIGARALVALDHRLHGRFDLDLGLATGSVVDARRRLEAAGLARPQLFVVSGISGGISSGGDL